MRFSATLNEPTCSISPASLSFKGQPVGTTSPAQTVTLSNTCNAAPTIPCLTITRTNANNSAETNNYISAVAVEASGTISVTFKPTASGSPQTATFTGTGSSNVILSWGASPNLGVDILG
jgi:hypothetical protein